MSITLKLHGAFHNLNPNGAFVVPNTKKGMLIKDFQTALYQAIASSHPDLSLLIEHSRFAQNGELIIEENTPITKTQVTILPPVSGG